VGNKIHHINAGDILHTQKVHRLTFLFGKNGHQHIGALYFLFAGRLHMEDGALQNALKTQSRLGLGFGIVEGDHRRGGIDKLVEIAAQHGEINTTGLEHLKGGLVVEQGQQQMFHRHEFVALVPGNPEGAIEG